jgi:outer membrane protein assembly factor BamB
MAVCFGSPAVEVAMKAWIQTRSLGKLLAVAALACGTARHATAADRIPWPEKSGPTADGRLDPADAAGVPVSWDEETGKNIAWSIPLEGEGHSTPVIGGGRLWFTAATTDGKEQFVYCIDAATGKVLHHKRLFENPQPEPLGNGVNTYASPSCVLETDAVYVHFGTYGTARLNPETAEVIWQRRDLNCRHYRGPGSSPIVYQNLLILTFDGIDKQFTAALDKQTGATVWITPRSTDYGDLDQNGKPRGDGDLRKAYGTPTVTLVDGKPQLISIGSRAAFGYDVTTGKEIWTFAHENFNASARPLFLPGIAILNTGSERAHVTALKLDGTTTGNITKTHVLWQRKKANAALSAPVLVGERLFFVTNQGVAYGVDGRSGEELWAHRIGGSFTASPIVVEDRIYFPDEKGTTTVVRAAAEYEELAANVLADGMRASPAAAAGALYLRTFDRLYKLAEGASRKSAALGAVSVP